MQLASPPGRGRIRAAPSPTPPIHVHPNRHLSTSDEDNNAFDDKEEVYKNLFYIILFYIDIIYLISINNLKIVYYNFIKHTCLNQESY